MNKNVLDYFKELDHYRKNLLFFDNSKNNESLPENIFISDEIHNTYIFTDILVKNTMFANVTLPSKKFIFINCQFEEIPEFRTDNTDIVFQEENTITNKEYFTFKSLGKINSLVFHGSKSAHINLDCLKVNNLKLLSARFRTFYLNRNNEIENFEILNTRTEDQPEFDFDRIELYEPKINKIKILFLGNIRILRLHNITAEKIEITGGRITQAFYLDLLHTEELTISSISECKWLYLNIINTNKEKKNETIKKIKLRRINSEKLQITHQENGNKIDSFEIENCNSLDINNLRSNSISFKEKFDKTCKIKNSLFNEISFENFRANHYFELNNININGKEKLLAINNSIFDNTNITPSFLHQVEKVTFTKSSIVNLKINNFIGISDRAINPRIRDSYTDYLDLYRELKSIASKENNQYLIQKFKSLEYNELLKDKRQNISLTDKIILFSSKYSNNHTTDPILAFRWIIVINIFFGFALGVSVYLNDNFVTANQVYKNISYFFNPLKLLRDFNLRLHGIIYILEFFYKIAIGYLIYQFIASFRKFNK